jgi:FkbM family methyltransferase
VIGVRNGVQRAKRVVRQLARKDLRYRIQIRCPKQHHGSSYGGWSICPEMLQSDSTVYSFGIGEDISFDLSLIDHFDVTVHAFDPTPRSIEWVKSQQLPTQFKLFEYGIADYDGLAEFFSPKNPDHVSHTLVEQSSAGRCAIEVQVYKLKSIMSLLGHTKINLLKMDIEGAEYGVVKDLLASAIEVDQMLIEFHHRLRGIGPERTKHAIEMLNQSGYRIFHISPNGQEYSFMRS